MPVKRSNAWKKEHNDLSALAASKRASRSAARKPPSRDALPTIDKSMQVAHIVSLCPEAQSIMTEYGLHCFSCSFSTLESLEEGCLGHGMTSEDVDTLVDDINEKIRNTPPRPHVLNVTLAAAEALRAIASEQGKAGHALIVTTDEHGGFCMEFREETNADEKDFFSPDAPDIRVRASVLTLQRIGGSTIDYRDQRFKLDVPGANTQCHCGGSCSCGSTEHC